MDEKLRCAMAGGLEGYTSKSIWSHIRHVRCIYSYLLGIGGIEHVRICLNGKKQKSTKLWRSKQQADLSMEGGGGATLTLAKTAPHHTTPYQKFATAPPPPQKFCLPCLPLVSPGGGGPAPPPPRAVWRAAAQARC